MSLEWQCELTQRDPPVHGGAGADRGLPHRTRAGRRYRGLTQTRGSTLAKLALLVHHPIQRECVLQLSSLAPDWIWQQLVKFKLFPNAHDFVILVGHAVKISKIKIVALNHVLAAPESLIKIAGWDSLVS